MNPIVEIERQANLQAIGESIDHEPLAELAQQATKADREIILLSGNLAVATTFGQINQAYSDYEKRSGEKLNNNSSFLALFHAAMLQGLDVQNYRLIRRLFLHQTPEPNDRTDLIGSLMKCRNSAEVESAYDWWQINNNLGIELTLIQKFESIFLTAHYRNITSDALKDAIKYYLQNK